MTTAILLAGLAMAGVTASPLPSLAPDLSSRPTLSFTDGLRRLILHASNLFSEDRDQQISKNNEEERYSLNFRIAGLTSCEISVGGASAVARCQAYSGNDAASARSTFLDIEGKLHGLAGKESRFLVEEAKIDKAKVTVASYWPSESVDVTSTLIERQNVSDVNLEVSLLAKY